jgi:hypothetical protein
VENGLGDTSKAPEKVNGGNRPLITLTPEFNPPPSEKSGISYDASSLFAPLDHSPKSDCYPSGLDYGDDLLSIYAF